MEEIEERDEVGKGVRWKTVRKKVEVGKRLVEKRLKVKESKREAGKRLVKVKRKLVSHQAGAFNGWTKM